MTQRGSFQGIAIGSITDGPPRQFALSAPDYASITTPGYFNQYGDTLEKGDTVYCLVATGETYRMRVTDVTAGVVTVADAAASELASLSAQISDLLALGATVTSMAGDIAALDSRLDALESTAPPDTTPPTNVPAFVAYAVSSSQNTLQWSASSDPESGIAAYHIYDNGAAQPIVVPGTDTVYQHTGLGASEFHEYVLWAINGSGLRSQLSITASATTLAAPAGLPVVSAGTITPTNNTKIMAVSSLAASNSPTHFLITVAEAAQPSVNDIRWDTLENWENGNAPVVAPSYGQVYNYRIWAKNDSGVSTAALVAAITTNDTNAPNAVTGLGATAITQSGMTVEWNTTTDQGADGGSGMYGYNLRINGVGPLFVPHPTASIALVGMQPSTLYSITITAVDNAGNETAQSTPITPTTLASGGGGTDATIIVDPATGNDSYTYAQVTSDPATYKWATLGRACWGSTVRPVGSVTPEDDGNIAINAAEAAKAGDIIDVYGPQDYPYAWNNGSTLYRTANSGSSGSGPIIFRAVGTVNLTHTGGGTLRAVFGAHEASYIQWEGNFRVDCANFTWTGDRAPCVFWGTSTNIARGCVVDGATLIGTDRTAEGSDNWSGVRYEYASNCLTTNCTISGFVRGNSHGYGVISYDSTSCETSHNEIFDCNGGVTLKAQRTIIQVGMQTHHNHIHDCNYVGVYAYGVNATGIYLNQIEDIGIYGVYMLAHNDLGQLGPASMYVVNNVLYRIDVTGANTGGAFAFKLGNGPSTAFDSDFFANNIVHTCRAGIVSVDDNIPDAEFSGAGNFSFQHNCYYNVTVLADLVSGDQNFTYWTGTIGQDDDTYPSLNADPLFTNPSTGDFTLQGGSPAILAGRDLYGLFGGTYLATAVDMGLYNETVGPV
ncbi:fibronectin type III domain-containing protein [Primorskyibacter sedentarius]|uniref:fibronectin type III domain-containing protein n=1 Tax=Primorskyibacter sedentarius TaxID=745311 RepID=UPI003EB76395